MNCLISWNVPLQWSLQAQQVPLELKGHLNTAPVYHSEVQVSQLSPNTLSSAAYLVFVPDHIPFQVLIILLPMLLTARETAGHLVSAVFVLSPQVSICIQDLKSESVLSSFQCPFGYPTPLFPEQEMRGQLPTVPSSVCPSATRGPPTAAVPQPHAINQGRRSGCPSAIALWGWSLTSGCLSLWGPFPSISV